MKKGKRFLENENFIIYVGTAIFFILAISIGIVMYMTTRRNLNIGKNLENNVSENKSNEEQTENVSTSIGKTVEEQENSEANNENALVSDDTTNNNISSNENEDAEETSTQNNLDNTDENTVKEEKPDESDTQASNIETSNDSSKVTETKKDVSFIKPVEGEIIGQFAKDNLVYSETLKEWVVHTGIDIKTDKTSVIKTSANGVIKSIVNDPRYGLTVVISHDDGYETVYSNLLTAEFVVVGEEVEQGQTIGTAGNTAVFESGMECHLHFEIIKDGEYLDPTVHLK